MATSDPSSPGTPLPEAARVRGRWLAWTSHPAGMIHRYAYTADLPTLALVSLARRGSAFPYARRFMHGKDPNQVGGE